MIPNAKLVRFFPFLRWRKPGAESLKRDAWAGFSVGLVLIPQAVAYATLAGMPPETGLYAALVPAIVGVLWGSSPLLGVGPVAMTSLLTFGSLSPLAVPGSANWVALAIWLSLYAGLIQFALGAFRLGRIANLVSQPVMTGFVNAAAIIIIVSQLPALLGRSNLFSGDFHEVLEHMLATPGHTLLSFAFGAGAIAILVLCRRLSPTFPAVLLVSVLGILISHAIGFTGETVGAIPAGLPSLVAPPAIPLASHQELWPAALVLALISFTEAMSSARTIARKRHEQWDQDQELIGQGLAKLASGLNGAFPVSASFSRSALNLYMGAASGWATLFAALSVLLCLLFLTDWVAYMPRSVLAAMVIVPVSGLIDIAGFRRVMATSRTEGAIAIVTFAVTILAMPRLHWGVVAGVGLTMAAFLYRRTQPRIAEVGQHADGTLRDRARFHMPPLAPDVLAVRLDAALIFLTSPALERFINEKRAENPQIRRVLLCFGSINEIDTTGLDLLAMLKENLALEGVDLYACAIKKQVWDPMEQAGLIAALGQDHIFATDAAAIAAFSGGKAVS